MEFAPIFKLGYEREQIPNHVRSGFKKCGLYPYDPEAVDYTKCVQNTLERLETGSTHSDETSSLSLTDFESTVKVLNTLKSRVNHKIDDINWVLNEIKVLKNNVSNTVVEEDTTIDHQSAIIEEYHVNEDGSLFVVAENQDNELDTANNISEIEIDNLAENFSEEDLLILPERQDRAVTEIDLFEKHLRYPKPIEKSKHSRAGPSTSAISAEAWRSYYINKENEKKKNDNFKKRKKEEAQRKKPE